MKAVLQAWVLSWSIIAHCARHRRMQALIEYAKRHGHVLAADQKGPMGVTQLHLAALLPDGGTMAELLVLQCLPGTLIGLCALHGVLPGARGHLNCDEGL